MNKIAMATGMHALSRAELATGMHALSRAELETALCARGPRDLTPLAQACDAGDARAVSELLSLGAARSIFVQGFRAQELLCTLPYTPVVPERHASAKGRALAEQRREVCENSQALVAAGDVKAAVDAALADYITQLAAGAVEFAAGVENESVAGDDETETKELRVHRVVLAAASGYFAALWAGGFLEAANLEVDIPGQRITYQNSQKLNSIRKCR